MPVFKNYIKTNFELDFKLFFWNIVENEKELSLGLKFNSVLKEKLSIKNFQIIEKEFY